MHQFYHFVYAETTPSEATDPITSFYICSRDYRIQVRVHLILMTVHFLAADASFSN